MRELPSPGPRADTQNAQQHQFHNNTRYFIKYTVGNNQTKASDGEKAKTINKSILVFVSFLFQGIIFPTKENKIQIYFPDSLSNFNTGDINWLVLKEKASTFPYKKLPYK